MSAELRQVADGCAYRVKSFTDYDVNGYRFHTTSHKQSRPNRRTTNTRVFTQALDGVEYYGRIEEIYELMFHGVYTKIWKNNRRDSKAPKIVSSRNQLYKGRYQLI